MRGLRLWEWESLSVSSLFRKVGGFCVEIISVYRRMMIYVRIVVLIVRMVMEWY